MSDIWAIIPVKEFDGAKDRLSDFLSPPQRRILAETMLADVMDAVAGSRLLAGIVMVTLDPHATAFAKRIGARVVTDGARDGHTGSVNAGRRMLARDAVFHRVAKLGERFETERLRKGIVRRNRAWCFDGLRSDHELGILAGEFLLHVVLRKSHLQRPGFSA